MKASSKATSKYFMFMYFPLPHRVFAGKIAVGQRLLDAVLDLFGSLFQLHGT